MGDSVPSEPDELASKVRRDFAQKAWAGVAWIPMSKFPLAEYEGHQVFFTDGKSVRLERVGPIDAPLVEDEDDFPCTQEDDGPAFTPTRWLPMPPGFGE